jgi:transcriptional regulator with XRE-family HTH domain
MISLFIVSIRCINEIRVVKRIIKKSTIKTVFGRAVRSMRLEQNLSQEKLAERANLHTNYIGSVERGERNVTLESICKIADGLNSHPADLFKKIRHPFSCTEK